MAPPHKKRRIKLIDPPLQLRLTRVFLLMAGLSMVVQGGYLLWRVQRLAETLPDGGGQLRDHLPGFTLSLVLVSALVLLPLTVLVGVHATFRVAGPLYRFSRFLEGVETRRHLGSCRIRKNDQLQDICELLNQVTEPLRQSVSVPVTCSDPGEIDSCPSATKSR